MKKHKLSIGLFSVALKQCLNMWVGQQDGHSACEKACCSHSCISSFLETQFEVTWGKKFE